MVPNRSAEDGDRANEEPPKEKRSKRKICTLMVLLLAIGVGVAGYLLSRPPENEAAEPTTGEDSTTIDNQQEESSGVPSTSPSLVPTEVLTDSLKRNPPLRHQVSPLLYKAKILLTHRL